MGHCYYPNNLSPKKVDRRRYLASECLNCGWVDKSNDKGCPFCGSHDRTPLSNPMTVAQMADRNF